MPIVMPPLSGFVSGTLVHTDYGFAPIEWVDVGTKVLARCVKTGQQGYRRVTRVSEFKEAELRSVVYEAELCSVVYVLDDGNKDYLLVTADYPVWVQGIGWVEAAQLKVGQNLEICDPVGMDDDDRPAGARVATTLSGRRWSASVVRVSKIDRACGPYDLEVEDFHTYFVGQYGVLVSDLSSR
jgi:hypothetical protein